MSGSITKEDLRELVEEVRAQGPDPELHKAHHEWLNMEIERRKRQRDRAEKIKLTMIGAATLAFVGTVGTLLSKLGAIVVAYYEKGGH